MYIYAYSLFGGAFLYIYIPRAVNLTLTCHRKRIPITYIYAYPLMESVFLYIYITQMQTRPAQISTQPACHNVYIRIPQLHITFLYIYIPALSTEPKKFISHILFSPLRNAYIQRKLVNSNFLYICITYGTQALKSLHARFRCNVRPSVRPAKNSVLLSAFIFVTKCHKAHHRNSGHLLLLHEPPLG